jgi:hypothetical protein
MELKQNRKIRPIFRIGSGILAFISLGIVVIDWLEVGAADWKFFVAAAALASFLLYISIVVRIPNWLR